MKLKIFDIDFEIWKIKLIDWKFMKFGFNTDNREGNILENILIIARIMKNWDDVWRMIFLDIYIFLE